MISYERSDEVAWITIDRPEKANAIGPDGWRALGEAVRRAGSESRVAVVAGAGETFSAGDDINELSTWDSPTDIVELVDCVYDAYHGIERTDVPVIAAVDGIAYGGGLELVIASDLAVATERSSFALPEGRIGAYPPFAVERINHAGGRKRMMELVLSGQPIDAETAQRWGLVNRVVSGGDLEDEVASLVDGITQMPKRSARIAKRYVNQDIAVDAERTRMLGAFSELFLSGDLEEGVRSFIDDSEPEYRS